MAEQFVLHGIGAAHGFRTAGDKWSTFIIWAKNTFTLDCAKNE